MKVKTTQSNFAHVCISALLTALWFFFSPALAQTAQAEIIYVDVTSSETTPDGSIIVNLGTSWEVAFPKLQDALVEAANNADPTDEIWVAQGVYYPHLRRNSFPDNPHEQTFQLLDNVAIYGGFKGGETERSQRDWENNLTILSGDVDNNDTAPNGVVAVTTNINGLNAIHVVTASDVGRSAVLDGFTITAGQADRATALSCDTPCGGGMLNASSVPTIANVIFRGNAAINGGGMANRNSQPTLTNVAFIGNSASENGGGLFNTVNSAPELTNVVFNANFALNNGGGMVNEQSFPKLVNTTFSANTATNNGGAMDNLNSTVTLANVIIWGNQATNGNSFTNIGGQINATFSLIENANLPGLGNLDGTGDNNNPRFRQNGNPAINPPTPGNLRLETGSSAINAGNSNATTIATDIDGNPRILNKEVDMGAYETLICPEGGVLHVKAGGAGNNDGTSWEDAFAFLQDALAVRDGCEIWVAKGVYYPDEGREQVDNDRNSAFRLKVNVHIYGGFAGTETQRNQRNWQNNATILSGDIDGNDTDEIDINDPNGTVTSGTNVRGANAFHVVVGVVVVDTATIDGFTITAGQANGEVTDLCAQRCGGGMFTLTSTDLPTDTLILANIVFSDNFASERGGGMSNNNSSPSLNHVTFHNNATNFRGGGMANFNKSNPTLTNVSFHANSARHPDRDLGFGGGIDNDTSSPTLINVSFNANSAKTSGGGMFNDNSNATLTNVSFHANQAINLASSSGRGGGIFNNIDNNISLTNVILWGNLDQTGNVASSQISNFSGGPNIRHSLIQGSNGSGPSWDDALGFDGGNNIDVNPGFVTEGNTNADPPTLGNLRLQIGSPAINAGDTTAIEEAVDLDGNLRVHNGTVDMGAYETLFCPEGGILHVNKNHIEIEDGIFWENALLFLQDALTVGDSCEIWVARGVYYPDEGSGQTDNHPSSTFQLRNGIAIYGGFDGTETQRNQRAWRNHLTVLSGDIDQNDINAADGIVKTTGNISGTNAYNITTSSNVTASATLDGFTITGGNAIGNVVQPCGPSCGGGMINTNSSPTLSNLTFSGNQAKDGGGMYNNTQSNPSLTKVIFRANSAEFGGGIYNLESNPTLTNIAFNGNSAGSGGGMINERSNPTLTNVSIHANRSTFSGAGMRNLNANPILTNVIIWGNRVGAEVSSILNEENSQPTINFSLVEGDALSGIGTGNLDGSNSANAPLFVQDGDATTEPPILGNLRLQAGSPAFNVGDPNLATADTDLDNNPRVQNGRVDLGAYETLPCPEGGILHVKAGGAGNKDGTSWENALAFLQDALDVSNHCEIWVAAGTYTPDEGSGEVDNNRNSTFQLLDNVAIYGGFSGTETQRNQRDWQNNVTVLSGDIDKNDKVDANQIVADTANITGTNAYHVVTGSGVSSTTLLDGFTITAGDAFGRIDSQSCPGCGGGMYNNSGSPTLKNLTFHANRANAGGGMYNFNSSSRLTNITFHANQTFFTGGGVLNFSSNPIFTNVTFNANKASVGGGGALNSNSSPTFTNAVFNANSAVDGGGMFNFGGSPTLTNATFNANQATERGGGILNDASSLTLSSVVIWGNQAASGPSILSEPSQLTLNFSLVEGDDLPGSGTGNLIGADAVDDPFVQSGDPTANPPSLGNLRLRAGSPAIDSGNTISFTNVTSITVDLDGNPRIQGVSIDMGAYESTPTATTPTDIVVVNTANDVDDGQCDAVHCSLREAINATNQATPPLTITPLTITFNLPISSALTISPAAPLPTLESGVTIDGTSQSGASCTTPLITLDGSNAGAGTNGFQVNADDVTIQGLSIVNYAGSAILLNGAFAQVSCNYLGLQVGGVTPAGNGEHGVHILDGAVDNTVGGKETGNVIAHNGGDGVRVSGTTATGNFIAENLIHNNGGLGIDLAGDGITANDSGDGDGGANNGQNHPVLTAVASNGVSTTITGTLNSLPNIRYLVEFYANDAGSNDTASCQGQTFVGFVFVTTDGDGNANINKTLPTAFASGQTLASTASALGTDAVQSTFDTSEFSACIPISVSQPPLPNTAPIANLQTVNAGQNQPKEITLSGSDADGDTLFFAIGDPPLNGTVSRIGNIATYTPTTGFVGVDSFTFKINDGTVDSNLARITINVSATLPPNTVPVANPQTVNAEQGKAIVITLTGSDADSDPLSFIPASQPSNGRVRFDGAEATYTPDDGFVGEDSFTFMVKDGTVDSAPATVTIRVESRPGGTTDGALFLPYVSG